ncbi:MAG TPA: cytochrome c family protein [Oxalicibacterium sp.]|uniref:c-type cytochrome n=1 Tax=Oxalicibacterium sp. TaxID=2766525 RepID=UPI002C452ABB|nr:cytochrome c family protein [Oxalicibacterium sp.]HWT71864.1 cytochrome c family protein [Oxalicibacterium sp.]HWU97011.1 cytochrome c family protein [Oxalicibacterium sp.]
MLQRASGKTFPCAALAFLLALAACGKQAGESRLENAASGDAIAGKKVFNTCANCHQVGPSARGGFGPQLNGIIGRPAGSTSDYRYSAAMKDAGFVWTEDKLRAFLRDPDTVVPGNRMRFFGIRSERDMKDLLAYLRSVS